MKNRHIDHENRLSIYEYMNLYLNIQVIVTCQKMHKISLPFMKIYFYVFPYNDLLEWVLKLGYIN